MGNLGLGPLAVGFASDILAGPFGLGSAEGVRWALIGSQFLVIPAFVCFWLAQDHSRGDGGIVAAGCCRTR